MPKRVIEIPDELNELGDVVEAIVANVLRTVARTGGGKAVDYAQVETAVSENAAGVERATHRAILQSLDIDVPAVIIGGVRYNRVGRGPAPYHTMAGSVSIERSLYRRSGTRGGTPDGKVVDAVSLRAGVVGDGWLHQGDMIGLRDRLVVDVATLASKRPDLRIQLLCDGAPEMWNLLDEWFTSEMFGGQIDRLVDLHHVMEKLGAAAKVMHGSEGAGPKLRDWKLHLLNRPRAAEGILEEMVASGLDEGPGDDHPVHAAITYLQSHSQDADRMNYARARRLGLALGSGNVEVTGKSLFEVRLKRCGSR